MKNQTLISADAIRQTLVDRAQAYADRHKVTLSYISKEAVKDNKFLADVKKGRNFTLESYQRVMDWLDNADRETAA